LDNHELSACADERILLPPAEGVGTHLIADLYGCDEALLKDPSFVESALLEAIESSGATLLRHLTHRFEPFGITAIAVLAESHLAIHTWPEHAYVSVDIFTCGHRAMPALAIARVAALFRSTSITRWSLTRGTGAAGEMVHGQ
jgi:S-adenosylmethionine decarboxylase